MIGAIPFSIPAKFAAGLAEGSLMRFGTIIKNVDSGHIVAHVQETGLLQNLVGKTLEFPFSPISTVSSLGGNMQLAVVTKMLASLQILQIANLGISLAGIGVSMVGFKMMNNRLDVIQSQMSALAQDMESQFFEVKEREFRLHQSYVNSLLSDAGTALLYSASNSQAEWLRVSSGLGLEASFYRGEVDHLLTLPHFNENVFRVLVQLYSICSTARIKCLLMADELPAARGVSEMTAKQYNLTFDHISPLTFAKQTMGREERVSRSYDTRLREKLPESKKLMNSLRDAQNSALCRPLLIDYLIEKGISGRIFLKQLDAESEEPIICLETSD
jgi:hypothetical protein